MYSSRVLARLSAFPFLQITFIDVILICFVRTACCSHYELSSIRTFRSKYMFEVG